MEQCNVYVLEEGEVAFAGVKGECRVVQSRVGVQAAAALVEEGVVADEVAAVVGVDPPPHSASWA